MEIDARNQSIQSYIDLLIEEARRDENLAITDVAHDHDNNFKGKILNLTKQISELREEAT